MKSYSLDVRGFCRAIFGHAVLVVTFLLVSAPALWSQNWKLEQTFALPDVSLSDFLKSELGMKVDDHGLKLGGVGSDLWHAPEDGPDVFWMVTDRGPNWDVRVDSESRLSFPVPEFTPSILKVQAKSGALQILKAIPITGSGPAERGVSGLSNSSRDGTPYNCGGEQALPFNAHGVDTEGMVRMRDGTFWFGEEYAPSIIKVSADGKVLKRFLPANLTPPTVTPGYPSVAALPEIFGKRRTNRGFEGMAVTPDEKLLYVVLQSPLFNPDKGIGQASRSTRILAFDPKTENVVGEYVYELQPASEFGETDPGEMKVSALAMLDQNHLLALERTDRIAKVYRLTLTGATDISGGKWDQGATQPSLESLDDKGLSQSGVLPLAKELLAELDSAKGFPEKIEGLTVVDDHTVAIANDNDFGISSFTSAEGKCALVDSGAKSKLLILKFNKPLLTASREVSSR